MHMGKLFISILVLSAGLHLPVSSWAQGPFEGSLIFSPHEHQAIEAALGLRPVRAAVAMFDDTGMGDPDTGAMWSIDRVQLSAMIYAGPADWSVWLGGVKIGPGQLPPYLSDLRVSPNYVDVSVISAPGAAPVPVRLRPNQTFLVTERRIVEGADIAR